MAYAIPIIKIHKNLLVSIQMELSDRLVLQLRDDITAKIQKTETQGLIIEVSGVDILDSYIARSIRDIAQIARLMGVQTILVGLDPNMAITLVEMGLILSGVSTALNLESALAQLEEAQKNSEMNSNEIITAELEPDELPLEFDL